MKTDKLKLHEISGSELNELEMCRVLGGGEVQITVLIMLVGLLRMVVSNAVNMKEGLLKVEILIYMQ